MCYTLLSFWYRRLWLFSAPRQLGAYYYISTYIITVTGPGLLSACALNRMLRLGRCHSEKWRSEHETERCHCYGPSNVRRLCYPREPNKKELGTCPTTVPSALSARAKPQHFDHDGFLLLVELVHSFLFLESISLWKYGGLGSHFREPWGACHLRSCHLFNVSR